MRKIIRKLAGDVLPILNSDLIALIETVAECINEWKSLPERKGKITASQRKEAYNLLQDIHDWQNASPTILGYIYEALLETGTDKSKQGPRRKGGIFYTPAYITKYLVKAALKSCRREHLEKPPMVIDPACGGGAFLIPAFKELSRRYPGRNPQKIAIENLHGVDTDPNAVHVARISIWLAAKLEKTDWKFLKRNIRQGDTLVDFVENKRNRYHVVVGNPPYRNVKRGISPDTREFCKANYRSATGQWDISAPFVENALRFLMIPGGACGFIVPNPVLLAENYLPIREVILENDIVEFGPAGKVFDDPGVEASLLVVRAGRSRRRSVTILEARNEDLVKRARTIPLALIKRLPFNNFSHLADESTLLPILDAVDSGKLVRLGDLISFTRGIECGKNDPMVLPYQKKVSGKTRPLITGESVLPYYARPSHRFRVPETTDSGRLLKDPDLWKGKEQLLLRRVADKPIAAVSSPARFVLNTIYVTRGEAVNKHAVCALINSGFFRMIFKKLFAFEDLLFPYLRISQLSEVPVPPSAIKDSALSKWSRELHAVAGKESGSLGSRIAEKLQGKIDRRVSRLYGCG